MKRAIEAANHLVNIITFPKHLAYVAVNNQIVDMDGKWSGDIESPLIKLWKIAISEFRYTCMPLLFTID